MTRLVFIVFNPDQGATPFQARDFLHFTDLEEHAVYDAERKGLIRGNAILVGLEDKVNAENFRKMMSKWLEKCNVFTQQWGNEKLTQDLRTCVNEARDLLGWQPLHFRASAAPNEHAAVLAAAFNDMVAQTVAQSRNGGNMQNVMAFLHGMLIMWPVPTSDTHKEEYVAGMVQYLLTVF